MSPADIDRIIDECARRATDATSSGGDTRAAANFIKAYKNGWRDDFIATPERADLIVFFAQAIMLLEAYQCINVVGRPDLRAKVDEFLSKTSRIVLS